MLSEKIYTSEHHNKIVKTIAEHGYITVDEGEIIVGERRKAYNIMQYLYTKGTLGTFSTRLHPTKAYYLPQNTKIILEQSGHVQFIKPFYPSMYYPTTFYHHIVNVKVHLLLEKVYKEMFVNYKTEHRIKQERSDKFQKICDAEITFANSQGQKKVAGIEIELTTKSTDKTKETLNRLEKYAQTSLDLIIIFYNNIIIKKKFLLNFKKNTFVKPVFFINLQAFLKSPRDTKAEKQDGTLINLF